MKTNVEIERPGWLFYAGWVVLHVVAVVLAGLLAWWLVAKIADVVGGRIEVAGQSRITEDFLLAYVFFPSVGLLTGLIQRALLHRYIERLRWWIPATVLGWLMPFAVGALFNLLPRDVTVAPLWVIVQLGLLGASIGIPQWWLLRRQFPHAAWWIVAWGIGWGLIVLFNSQTSSALLAFLLSVAALPAIATAFACWLLLDWYPKREGAQRAPAQ